MSRVDLVKLGERLRDYGMDECEASLSASETLALADLIEKARELLDYATTLAGRMTLAANEHTRKGHRGGGAGGAQTLRRNGARLFIQKLGAPDFADWDRYYDALAALFDKVGK